MEVCIFVRLKNTSLHHETHSFASYHGVRRLLGGWVGASVGALVVNGRERVRLGRGGAGQGINV